MKKTTLRHRKLAKQPSKTRTKSLRAANSKGRKQAKGETVTALTGSATASRRAHKRRSKSETPHRKVDAGHQTVDRVHDHSGALRHPTELEGSTHAFEPSELIREETPRTSGKPFPIVGIGASAGGYEAFADLLAHLPKDTGLAFVLVQHLDPNHKSRLTELLGQTSKVPVLEARNEMDVEPNLAYVIPENVSLTIGGGRLRLSPRREKDVPPMPIDTFFRSLANDQHHLAIGVVLSGTGTDGTHGIESIKGEGGITFAQDDRSSKFFGMPGSAISSGSVDFVLSPQEIALELHRLAGHPFVCALDRDSNKREARNVERVVEESPAEISRIFRMLRSRADVDFAFYKQSTLKRRIIRRMVLHKIEKLPDYVAFLESNPSELDGLFNDFLINVTSFFRDPLTFQVLKKRVFPRIVKARDDDSPLRLWACGCASGEEAYSLAISLIEFFEQIRSHRRVQIFATDVSEAGIQKARAGIYPENILQDVSQERLRRFFVKVDGSYQIQKSVRDLCVFARQNVVVDPPFSNLDLVVCRNVLIYFGPILQRKIMPLFHYALRPTGFLVLGNSETIGPAAEHFTLIDKKHKVYQKKVTYLRAGFDLHRHLAAPASGQPATAEKTGPPSSLLSDLPQLTDKVLLREFSPGAVVVNSDYEAVLFRGRTGDYFEHSPGTASLQLLKMARESLTMSLRTALNKANRLDKPVRNISAEIRQHHHTREIHIDVLPFKIGPANDRFFLVVFKEIDGARAREADRDHLKPGRGIRKSRDHYEFARLKQELLTTRESLQSVIEEQEATNEELKSANEEVQSSNEELQSTNEELETAKEELQSTNEELTTLNEELQKSNLELSRVNNDLTNLLASVNLPILMVANDLTLRRFTPMAERIFDLVPSDVGRRLNDLHRPILVPELDESLRHVIDDLVTIERETRDRDGHWYLLRIRPYRTHENKIDGAVIVLVDIDDVRRALDVVLGLVNQPLVMLGPELKVRNANEAFAAAFGLPPEKVIGQYIYDIGQGQWNVPELRKLLEEVLPQNKRVTNFEFEAGFSQGGRRNLRINAGRFFEESQALQMILLAVEDVTGRQ